MKATVCKWFSVCPMKRFNSDALLPDGILDPKLVKAGRLF